MEGGRLRPGRLPVTGTGPWRRFAALRLLLPLVAIGAALLLFLGVGLIISFGGMGAEGRRSAV